MIGVAGSWDWTAIWTAALTCATLLLAIVALLALRQTARELNAAEQRAERQFKLARQATEAQVFVGLLTQHYSHEQRKARNWIFHELATRDISRGLPGLEDDEREQVELVCFFYDMLGVLVTHDLIDVAPVSGFIGSSVVANWKHLEGLIGVERKRRGHLWQLYFENLVTIIEHQSPPAESRATGRWLLDEDALEKALRQTRG